MLALTSHHFVERTPSGEEAWLHKTLLPDDRRILGALRTGLTVAALLAELSLEPATVEVVLHRLARRGFVRIDLPPAISVEPEPDIPAAESQDDAQALSSLLARHAPAAPQEPGPSVSDVVESDPQPASGSRVYDESPLPMHGSPTQITSLMEVLRHGARATPQPQDNEITDTKESAMPVHSADMDRLMRALLRDGKPAPSTLADLSLPDDTMRRERAHAGSQSPNAVSSPRFLRMKDASSEGAAGSTPSLVLPLPSMPDRNARRSPLEDRAAIDAARREHAQRKRAEREAQAEARRADMASRRQAELRQEEGNTFLGVSDRLRRVLDEQKNKG